MPKSVEMLVEAAQKCFFQHGYSASNVSLIGRYADISRATIYKNFSSKEDLFRAVVQRHIDSNQEALQDYVVSENEFWDDTEALIAGRCSGLFDDIPSNLIRTELIHAGQSHCEDIIQSEVNKVQGIIKDRIEKETALGRLSIEGVGMNAEAFAKVIESIPLGVAFSSYEENNLEIIMNMFRVFRASTK